MKCHLEAKARGLGLTLDSMGIATIARITQTVTEVREDGSAVVDTLAEVLESVPAPAEGQPLGGSHTILTLDGQRHLREIADAPDQAPLADTGYRDLIIEIIDGLYLPEQPVGVGDTWHVTHEITMPESGRVTEMDIEGELRGRVLDGERWVSVIYSELQIPLRLNNGDTEVRGNIGVRLNLEVYEDTGEIRYADGTGQGSAKPDLAVRVAKIKLSGFEMHLRQEQPDGRVLGSVLLPEDQRVIDAPSLGTAPPAEPAPEPAPEEPAPEESTPDAPAEPPAG
jgi:hypothetical protein